MPISRLAIILPLAILPVSHAQDAAPADPRPDPPAFAPPAQPAGPSDAQPARPNPLANKKITESIVEPKLNGNELAGLYREYTGRRVIVTRAAAEADFSFVQEASKQKPLTFGEAVELLRIAALLEGFAFTQYPGNPDLDVLTVNPPGPLKPTGIGPSFYSEGDVLPQEEIVINYMMKLSYISPDQAQQIFNQYLGQPAAYGAIMPVANASALLVTEKVSLVKNLIELKERIDVPGSVQTRVFIQVEHADATELASVINQLVGAEQDNQQGAAVQRAPQGGGQANVPAPGGGGAADGGGGASKPVQVLADARTNRILAVGRPVDLVFVEGLIREFDVVATQKTQMRRKLRFLTVSEFMPVAGDALSRAFSGTGDGASFDGGQRSPQSNARPSSGNSGRGNRSSSGGFGNNSPGGSGGAGGGSSVALNDPNFSTAPESLLVGRTQLVADNITNSLIVSGPPSALKIIDNLITELDVRPEQVMISTVIGQLTLDNSTEFGFNYLLDGEEDIRIGGGGSGFPLGDVTPGVFPTFDPVSLASSGLRAYGTVGDLTAYLRALSSKTDFTVLSRPSIFTTNNRIGIIESGEEIAIPTEGGTSTGSFTSGTRIQYEPVSLKLEVIPLVNSKDEITMEIALVNDEVNGSQTIQGAGTNGGDLTVPRIIKREIQTVATVPNGETIVLGGLIVDRDNEEKAGIPILGDIPVIGSLFSTKSKGKDRSELLVFIQPKLVGDNISDLTGIQSDFKRYYELSDRTMDFANGPQNESGARSSKEEDANPTEKRKSIGPRHRR